MTTYENAPAWQRKRAEYIVSVLSMAETMINSGQPRLRVFQKLGADFKLLPLEGGRKLRMSPSSIRRLYTNQWEKGQRSPSDYVLQYAARAKQVPDELVKDWRRRITQSGTQYGSLIYAELSAEWKAGHEIPGLGNWRDWWVVNRAGYEVPNTPPVFPFSYHTMMRYQPDPVTRTLGNKGFAAAREMLTKITRDYSTLRACELYVLDDVKADVAVIDETTGKVVEPVMYVMMEARSRFVAGFVTRGAASIVAADVDALIAHVLGTIGIAKAYPTHILFERGTVACSEARQMYLEKLFDGRLIIHRTSISGGKRTVGDFADRATGRPYSKGVIEAFMRKLHIRLSSLPGQTGNRYRNRPANLEKQIEQAEMMHALGKGLGISLESTPLLMLGQFNDCVRRAINDYNNDRDHRMTGFHKVLQVETAPGVWKDTPTIIAPNTQHQGGQTWGINDTTTK